MFPDVICDAAEVSRRWKGANLERTPRVAPCCALSAVGNSNSVCERSVKISEETKKLAGMAMRGRIEKQVVCRFLRQRYPPGPRDRFRGQTQATHEPDGLRRSRSARRGARTDGGGVHRGERPPAPRSKRVPSQIWPCFRELPSHDAVRLTPVPSSDEQTTIMACVYDGGVVLGADSRTSTGNYVANRASDKITQVMDNVWMCRSGSVRAPPLPFPTRPTRSPHRCDTPPASRSIVSSPRMTTPRLSPFVANPSRLTLKSDTRSKQTTGC